MKIKNLVFILSAFFMMACGAKKESEQTHPRPVKVTTIQSTSHVSRSFSGVVEATTVGNLAFRVSGQIIKFPVATGQKLKKGDLIAELDTRELSLQFSADKAAYETATAQYNRSKRLVEKEAISQQEYEVNKANYEKSKSAYENSVNNMRDSKLYAPFSGSIEVINVDNYERVNAGTPIVKLVNPSELQIAFTVPDNHLTLLQNSPEFSVEFDIFKNKKFNARIKQYVEVTTDGSGIPVSIIIDDPNFENIDVLIKPGFACNVNMNIDTKKFIGQELTSIPLSAIYADAATNTKNVWVVINNTVKLRKVLTGKLIGEDSIVVEAGLAAGETIVTAGVTQLKEGDKVTLIN